LLSKNLFGFNKKITFLLILFNKFLNKLLEFSKINAFDGRIFQALAKPAFAYFATCGAYLKLGGGQIAFTSITVKAVDFLVNVLWNL